jgi:hypothetical protein
MFIAFFFLTSIFLNSFLWLCNLHLHVEMESPGMLIQKRWIRNQLFGSDAGQLIHLQGPPLAGL